MDIDYDCYINHGMIKYPTFYWQMLDIDFETPMPPPNTRPVACFMVSPSSGDPDTVFNFNASCCLDAHDLASNLQVRWDWENDGVYDTPYTIAKTAAHQYSSTGTKTIKLQVRDTSGLDDTTTRYVIVSDDYVGWLSAFPTTGTVNPGDQMQINTRFNTTGLDPGVYSAEIVIENNDPDEDPVIVPVELTVVDGVCGDVTGEGAVNIVDAMYIAQYTVGNRPSSDLNMENADVNNCDGNVNIVDAMFIAQYTVGAREILECC
jgi:PKD repeat protein